MYAKKCKTKEICEKAINARDKFTSHETRLPLYHAEPFLYAKEIDKMWTLYNEIDRFLCVAQDRAEKEKDGEQ